MAEAPAAGRGIASPYHVAKKVNVMRAAEIMTRPVITVQPNTPLRDAVHELVDNGFAGLPVVDEDDRVIGVITERDALAASERDDGMAGSVADVMKQPVDVVAPDADTHEIVHHMLERHLRCLPVVADGELVGIISRRDLLRPLVRPDDAIRAGVARLLNDYTSLRSPWQVTSLAGVVTVSGRFRDHAERLVVEAIARTVPGVVSVEVSGEVSRARDLRVG